MQGEPQCSIRCRSGAPNPLSWSRSGYKFKPLVLRDFQTAADIRQRFIALWRENSGGDGYFAPIFADAVGKAVLDAEREVFLDGIFRDTVGFAATAIIRSITGYSHFLEMGSIADPDQKAASEAGALSLARAFLLHPEQFASIGDVVDAVRRHRRAKQALGTILVP
jgi:5-methylthioribose kinase